MLVRLQSDRAFQVSLHMRFIFNLLQEFTILLYKHPLVFFLYLYFRGDDEAISYGKKNDVSVNKTNIGGLIF